MTAGRGIIHQEMPTGDTDGRMHGFQLWANLPSSLKMTAPRYQDVKAQDVPVVVDDDGTEVRIVCGRYRGKAGPVHDIAAKPVYLDISIPAEKQDLAVETTSHAFAYVFAGAGKFCNASEPSRCRPNLPGGPIAHHRRTPTIGRSFSSTEGMRWRFRPETKGSGSCSSPASPSRSRSPGTVRSS